MSTSEFEEKQLKKLPPDPVECILKYLSYLDCRCLGHAIPNWLPIIRETLKPLNNWNIDSPCFISFTNDYKSCCLIDPLRGLRHIIQSPELPCNVKVLSSKYGWLLLKTTPSLMKTSSESANIIFYNPLSKAIVQLPPYEFHNEHVFSFSSPPTSSDCVVIAERMFDCMIICCKGDTKWTVLDDAVQRNEDGFRTLYMPAIFHKEKFHFLLEDGRIRIFDPVTRSLDVRGQIEVVKCHTHRHNLVASNDELFWVYTTENGGLLGLYKLDHSTYVWKETKSLEGMCFFLWRNSSISVSASTLKDNEERIYFPMLKDDQFVYYSCEQQKMFPKGNFYGVDEQLLGSCWIEPCWIQHTKKQLNWF